MGEPSGPTKPAEGQTAGRRSAGGYST